MGAATAFETGFGYGVDAAMSRVVPQLLNNTPQWLIDAFGGTKSDAGVRVNYTAAMRIAYVWSAISQISADTAYLPLNYLKIEADGDKIVDRTHPGHWLLNGDASDTMTGFGFRETILGHALLLGNGYAFVERTNGQRPVSLTLLDPTQIDAQRDTNGRLFYRDILSKEEYQPRDIFHLAGLGYDGTKGHSVIDLARNSFGLSLAQDQHGSKHFANGASPKIVLKHPKSLSKEQADELLAAWMAKQSGTENAGKPALAAGGLEIETLNVNNSDAQWLEARKFARQEVAVWFQMPLHKLGDDSNTAYNSLESENRAYIAQTLRRWMRRIEVECNRKLLKESVRRNFQGCFEHDTTLLIDSDSVAKANYLTKLREQKIVTGNEVRTRFGLPKVDGLDEFENPNTSSGAKPPESDKPAPDVPNETLAAFRRLIADRVERMLSAEAGQVERASKRFDEFDSWVDKFYAGWTEKLVESLDPVFTACSSLPGVALAMTSSESARHLVAESVAPIKAATGSSVDGAHLQTQITSVVNQWPARAIAFASFILPGE